MGTHESADQWLSGFPVQQLETTARLFIRRSKVSRISKDQALQRFGHWLFINSSISYQFMFFLHLLERYGASILIYLYPINAKKSFIHKNTILSRWFNIKINSVYQISLYQQFHWNAKVQHFISPDFKTFFSNFTKQWKIYKMLYANDVKNIMFFFFTQNNNSR